MTLPPRTSVRAYPFALTLVFGGAFVVLACLASLTALSTASPWFPPGISGLMYASTLVAASLGTLVVALLVATHLGADAARWPFGWRGIEALRPRSIEIEFGPNREGLSTASLRPEDLDRIFEDLRGLAAAPPVSVRRADDVQIVEVPVAPEEDATRIARDALYRAVARRGLMVRRAKVWPTLVGPMALLLAFVAIGGAMLPGSGEFAAAHFHLNTALILFLGYGWPFLVAWTTLGVASLHFAPELARPRRRASSRATRAR